AGSLSIHGWRGRLTAIARAVEVNSLAILKSALASFLPQRNQKQHDADRRQNDGDGKARGRDFAPEMIIFFKSRSKAYQERKNANAE
ncbi:MAG TPA: hypothetical protein VN825_00265, partial [Candidatus Acidoferrum sp.]|nr:hypothetical protein [Candidatus Acidoferrum sp.]